MTAAERQRRRRERTRRGALIVSIVLERDLIDEMIDARCLAEWDEDNKGALAEAVIDVIRNFVAPTAVTRDKAAPGNLLPRSAQGQKAA